MSYEEDVLLSPECQGLKLHTDAVLAQNQGSKYTISSKCTSLSQFCCKFLNISITKFSKIFQSPILKVHDFSMLVELAYGPHSINNTKTGMPFLTNVQNRRHETVAGNILVSQQTEDNSDRRRTDGLLTCGPPMTNLPDGWRW